MSSRCRAFLLAVHCAMHTSRTGLACNTLADARGLSCVHESNEQGHIVLVGLPLSSAPTLYILRFNQGSARIFPLRLGGHSLPIMQQPAAPLPVPLLAVAFSSLLQPFSSFSAPPPRHPVRIQSVSMHKPAQYQCTHRALHLVRLKTPWYCNSR